MASAFSRDYRKGEVPDMRTFIRRYRGAPGVGSGENMTNILSNITADVSKQILDVAAFSLVPFLLPTQMEERLKEEHLRETTGLGGMVRRWKSSSKLLKAGKCECSVSCWPITWWLKMMMSPLFASGNADLWDHGGSSQGLSPRTEVSLVIIMLVERTFQSSAFLPCPYTPISTSLYTLYLCIKPIDESTNLPSSTLHFLYAEWPKCGGRLRRGGGSLKRSRGETPRQKDEKMIPLADAGDPS